MIRTRKTSWWRRHWGQRSNRLSNNCFSLYSISESKKISRCDWNWFCKEWNWNIINSRLSSKYCLHRVMIKKWPIIIWPTLDRISADRFYHRITDLEPNAFEGKTSSIPDLRRYFLPLANINEFLIEKSPQYARGHIHEISNRAKSMHEANPNMKLFAFVTDPVERLFSHINHCIKKKWPFCQPRF